LNILIIFKSVQLAKKLTDKKIQNLSKLKTSGNIPVHIAIIMDGNGRWAKKFGLPRVAGHRKGVETVREIVEACSELGVKFLTLYTFSTENWKRPADEVGTLMKLMVKSLQDETDELHKNNIRLTAIGNLSSLPGPVKAQLEDAMQKTRNNTKMVLNLALSYSGRWELIDAVKKISQNVKNNEIDINDISEKSISTLLNTSDMPDPDLMIRSGGEMRISNFLLWQLAYAEIYFTKVLWPKFNTNNLIDAITDFQSRERRFGMVSEQISKSPENNRKQKN